MQTPNVPASVDDGDSYGEYQAKHTGNKYQSAVRVSDGDKPTLQLGINVNRNQNDH